MQVKDHRKELPFLLLEEEVYFMTSVFPLSSQLESDIFMAHSCSCSCDPCTCLKECTCEGADAYLGSRWRFIGDHILSGQLSGVDLAGRTLLQLAVTTDEKSEDWQEVVLIDEQATPKQAEILLKAFQQRTGSHSSHMLPSAYLAPIHYLLVEQRPMLCVNASLDRLRSVGEQQQERPLHTHWIYNGHVALQEQLDPREFLKEKLHAKGSSEKQ